MTGYSVGSLAARFNAVTFDLGIQSHVELEHRNRKVTENSVNFVPQIRRELGVRVTGERIYRWFSRETPPPDGSLEGAALFTLISMFAEIELPHLSEDERSHVDEVRSSFAADPDWSEADWLAEAITAELFSQ